MPGLSLKFFTIVREQTAAIVERLGRYQRTLKPGLNFLIPILDVVAYRQTLKEDSILTTDANAITNDNVNVKIEGALFFKVNDPYLASYKVENYHEAVKLLALTVLRSEIGKRKLDQLFQERTELSLTINQAVNLATQNWGLKSLRYEILTIDPPTEIKQSMQSEAEAERMKRRDILVSEGIKQANINIAQGNKISIIKTAEGQAEYVNKISESESQGLKNLAVAIEECKLNGTNINYVLLEQFLARYTEIISKGNIAVIPKGSGSGATSDLALLAAAWMAGSVKSGAINVGRSLNPAASNISAKSQDIIQKTGVADSQDLNFLNQIDKLEYFDDPILYNATSSKGTGIGEEQVSSTIDRLNQTQKGNAK